MVSKHSGFLVSALTLSLPFAMPAAAQARSFNIPQQPASLGIKAFGREAGIQILFSRKDTQDKRTNSVRGVMGVDAALLQLLNGTGLAALNTGPSTYTVMKSRAVGAPGSLAQNAQTAQAQPLEASDNPGEIIVTAQKRTETAFEVPISISVKSEQEIRNRNAETITDLQYSVPGLSISEFGPGQQRIQFRGVSSFSGLQQIGQYLDEIPLNTEVSDQGPDLRLVDIARIELLRGPQGTLYGQGAMGGTIRYITNDPELTTVSGSALGEVSVVDGGEVAYRGEGVFNLPLAQDQLGLRVAGGYTRIAGWIDNPRTGEDNINGGKSYFIRGKLLAKLGEDLTATFLASHQNIETGGDNVADAKRQVNYAAPTPRTNRINLFGAVLNYDLGAVSLVSATSWQERKGSTVADLTDIFAPLVELFQALPAGTVKSYVFDSDNEFAAFSQELRVQYDSGSGLRGLVGGFYRNSHSDYGTEGVIDPITAAPARYYAADYTEGSRSWAVFGDVTYELFDGLEANVGGRYFEDKRTRTATSSVFGNGSRDVGEDTFRAFTPKFNLSYKASDSFNLYATASKGFRSGGFNITSVGGGVVVIPPSYEPDSVWTYEAGVKFQTDDRRLTGEVAVFRNVWSGIQSVFTGPLGLTYTANGGKMAGNGIDAQLSYRPVPALTLSLTGGWNNMKYTTTTEEHFAGDRADYAPRYSGSASVEYGFELGGAKSFARADYQLADGIQVYFRSFQTVPALSETQNLLNFNVGTEISGVSLQLFAKNILNEYGVTYPAFGSLPFPGRPIPRSFGAQLRTSF